MPRRDGTGPIGMGAMTGRRAGFCNSGFDNLNLERCFGGNGCQRGYRRQFVQTVYWLFKKWLSSEHSDYR